MENPKVKPMDSIFLTLTYSPKYLSARKLFDFRSQFIKTICNLYNRLNRVSEDFMIFPEMTEVGNLHYHVVFSPYHETAEEYLQLNIYSVMRKEGFINASKIKNMEKTFEYCTKDWDAAKRILELNEMEYTEYGINKQHNVKALVREMKLVDHNEYDAEIDKKFYNKINNPVLNMFNELKEYQIKMEHKECEKVQLYITNP